MPNTRTDWQSHSHTNNTDCSTNSHANGVSIQHPNCNSNVGTNNT